MYSLFINQWRMQLYTNNMTKVESIRNTERTIHHIAGEKFAETFKQYVDVGYSVQEAVAVTLAPTNDTPHKDSVVMASVFNDLRTIAGKLLILNLNKSNNTTVSTAGVWPEQLLAAEIEQATGEEYKRSDDPFGWMNTLLVLHAAGMPIEALVKQFPYQTIKSAYDDVNPIVAIARSRSQVCCDIIDKVGDDKLGWEMIVRQVGNCLPLSSLLDKLNPPTDNRSLSTTTESTPKLVAKPHSTTLQSGFSMIWVTFRKEGIHNYSAASTSTALATGDEFDVRFLGHPHRHMFHFKVAIQVFHDDRDIEFIQFKRWCEKQYSDQGLLSLNSKSCEMISDELALLITTKWPGRHLTIEVAEDGENGSYSVYPVGHTVSVNSNEASTVTDTTFVTRVVQ